MKNKQICNKMFTRMIIIFLFFFLFFFFFFFLLSLEKLLMHAISFDCLRLNYPWICYLEIVFKGIEIQKNPKMI